MCEGPVEVPTGCRQCRRIGSVIPPFGEPACQIGRIGTGNVFIGKPAECAIRVLNLAPDALLAPQLRDIVGSNGVPENVRTAVLELLYKIDQPEVPGEFEPSDIQPVTLHNSP